ncbi:MAG TPA: beta-ketoacyl-ACP synthase II [Gemmatimonadaceae bacterium]|nr:beta-ketoacyl-ACP synthase II [Gemmatimonadaceae bacterium]
MRERRRVVVTGLGAITPVGLTKDRMWEGIRTERSPVRTIDRFDPSDFRSHVAAQVDDFVATDFLERKRAKRLDRFGHFAVVAARMALEDACLQLDKENRDRVAALMGTALGGVGYAEDQCHIYYHNGLKDVDPALALMVFGGSASCNIAIEFGVFGPNSTNAMSCASGTIAIGEAFRAIRDGYADVAISGGAEAPLWPLCFGAFAVLRAMSTRNDDPATACRPFDKDRDGFVMGEGAAVLILEEYERARARGARMYAEIIGFGSSNDGYHMTSPRPDGTQAARSMTGALGDAGIAPHEVQYVNAHASSTPLNDSTETLAIKRAFGEHAYKLQVSGTKAYYGHALGASGAIEAMICAMALSTDWLPPTVNLLNPQDGCDLDYIPRAGREARVEHLITNSFGFGGINATLAMRRVG